MFLKCWTAIAVLVLLSTSVVKAESFIVSDIRLQGLERITDGTLLNYLPVRVGDPFDDRDASYAIRQLYKTGFFKDINLARDGDVLVVQVLERPAIANVKFDGNKDIDDDQLKDILKDIGIIKGRVFNPSALDKIEQGLKQQAYYSQGKYGVRIETKVTELERNRVDIDIKISEGVVARIKQINIVGNKIFTDEELLDELQLGIPGSFSIFSSIDEYSKPKLAADEETIKSYYQDKGYIRFKIKSTQVTITPDKKDIYITINVEEGEQYNVSQVKILGKLVVDKSKLEKLLLIKPDTIFSRQEMTVTKDLLTKKLGEEGYAFARVRVIPEVDEENKRVALTYVLDPGKKVYVRRITFNGNYKTNDEVLRREMRLFEGSELSNAKLNRSKIRLQRLPYIEEVKIDKQPVVGTDDLVDVDIKVTERLSGSFNIGAGLSQTQGFVFNMGLKMDNLLGDGQSLSLNFNNDRANKVYSASFTNPYYTLDGISRTLSFSYRKRNAAQLLISQFSTNNIAARVSYGIPLSEYDSIRLGFGLDNTEIIQGSSANRDVDQFIDDFAGVEGATRADVSSATLVASYTHDTRNRTVFATKGSSQSVILDLTAPGSDVEYYKLTYRNKFYFTLTDDLTLLLKSDIAAGDSYGKTAGLPFYQRFYAGGLRTVRGFNTNRLGPIDESVFDENGELVHIGTNNVRGGDLRTVGGAEFIFPVPFYEKPPKSVRLSAFYDVGNVFLQEQGGFDVTELRSSVGVSFVWLAPIGPLRFSWAKALQSQPGDDIQVFQFSIGSFF